MGPDQAFRSQVAASLQRFLLLMIRAVSLLKSSEGSRVFRAMLRAVLNVFYKHTNRFLPDFQHLKKYMYLICT